MIDIEIEIFDSCARRVLAEFPEAVTSSANINAPASFPAVSIVQADSRTDSMRADSSRIEKGAVVSFDVECFSNLRTGAKAQAKKLANIVDEYMTSMNFTRTFSVVGEHPAERSIYRVRSRYVAGVDHNGKIYRRQ